MSRTEDRQTIGQMNENRPPLVKKATKIDARGRRINVKLIIAMRNNTHSMSPHGDNYLRFIRSKGTSFCAN